MAQPDYADRLLPSQGRLYQLNKKYKAFIGGVGSGKTHLGAIWARDQIPLGGDGMIVAPTYRMLEDVTEPALFAALDKLHWQYEHIRSRSSVLIGGSTIFLRSAERPERLRGPNLTWLWGDEAALWRDEVWKILLGRLRIGGARGLITTTPAGFNWVYHYWAEMQNEAYGMIRASTRENRHLDSDFVKSLEDSYTAEYAEQEIEGGFVTFEGLVYSEFSHDAKEGNIQTLEIQDDWRKVRGIDFGYTNPFVCLWGAIDNDGRLYIYDEHYKSKLLIKEHASIINREAGKFTWTVSDWDAQERAELEAEGIATIRAQKEVVLGIQKVKSRLKRQADGIPRLVVHPRCVNLIKEFASYRWNPKLRGGKEEPIKEADHAMDALRYMVMEIDGGTFVYI